MALQPSVDREVNTLVDTYLKNPQGLEQRARLDPSLVKGIALDRVKRLLRAEQNAINAQMRAPKDTVLSQEAQELESMATGGLGALVENTGAVSQAKGIASAAPRPAQSNQNMPKMASGGAVQKFSNGKTVDGKTVVYDDLVERLKREGIGSIEEFNALSEDSQKKLIDKLQIKGGAKEYLSKLGNLVMAPSTPIELASGFIRDRIMDIPLVDAYFGDLETKDEEAARKAEEERKRTTVQGSATADNVIAALTEQKNKQEQSPTGAGTGLSSLTGNQDMGGAGVLRPGVSPSEAGKTPTTPTTPTTPATPKAPVEREPLFKGLDSLSEDAMKNLGDAIKGTKGQTSDEAYDKFLERAGADELKSTYDDMRQKQEDLNKRYAASPKKEALDRFITFAANVASENRGVRGLSKGALEDQKLQQVQHERAQKMLDESLELDKAYLTDVMGLNKEAANAAATRQNQIDQLSVSASQTWANMSIAEKEAAEKALDREFQREESALKRAHDRIMQIMKNDAALEQLDVQARTALMSDFADMIFQATQDDLQLQQLRLKKSAAKTAEERAEIDKAIRKQQQNMSNAALTLIVQMQDVFDGLAIPSSTSNVKARNNI